MFDPEALIPAAAEVAQLAEELAAFAADAATRAWHGITQAARRVSLGWLLMCGCGSSWAAIKGLQLTEVLPDGDAYLYGLSFMVSCGCAAGLLSLQRRERARWREGGGRLILGGLADDDDDEYAAAQRERKAEARRLERAMRDGELTPGILAAMGLANRRDLDELITAVQEQAAELDSVQQTMREAVRRAGLDGGPPTDPRGWTPTILQGGAG